MDTDQDAINWPDARSVRFYDRDGKDFKYHRIIDWGAYERLNRTGLNQGVNHQKQIDWQDLGDQSRNTTVEPTDQGHNVSPNEQSGLVANTSSDSNNRSTKSTRKEPQTSVRDTEQASNTSENDVVKDKGTSNERNISARTKQDRAPVRTENGQRIDWKKKKRQSSQERSKPDQSAQTPEVVDTNTQRNQSDTKVRTIYLDEIDWQRVPRN